MVRDRVEGPEGDDADEDVWRLDNRMRVLDATLGAREAIDGVMPSRVDRKGTSGSERCLNVTSQAM